MNTKQRLWLGLLAGVAALTATNLPAAAQQAKRPNIVMLMTDDTGWNDFGAYTRRWRSTGSPNAEHRSVR